ncbi:MAG TPA: hypothetical protein VE781_06045 [Kineosporiaceae bacterium]|nr:hypothetical protein [Kineosporiaceae bacterium]
MDVLFDGEIHVHYGFMFLQPAEVFGPDLRDSRRGQANGLAGARIPGVLSFVTGLHTGDVPVRVEWHDTEPELGDDWEDVVEVPFTPADDEYDLRAFDAAAELGELPAGPHRARWLATGMDAANEVDVRMDGEPALDRYLLQLWPAPPAPDAVLRRGSEQAEYWHSVTTKR